METKIDLLDARRSEIIEWYNQSLAYKQIALKLDVSTTTIFRYITKLRNENLIGPSNVTSRDIVRKQEELILQWYNEGNVSTKEMAKRLGISASKVESRINRLISNGIITNLHHPRSDRETLTTQYQKIATWHGQGISRKEMAKRLGISISTVGNRISTLKKRGHISSTGKSKYSNDTDKIIGLERKVILNRFQKDDVNILIQLYIKHCMYKDAIILLDNYTKNNTLTKDEIILISQIRDRIQSLLLEKLDNEKER